MSNVLIGIIGVILFIGLALAGALFLGPRFQESTNNSKASAAVQAVSQVASAANMYNVQEGATASSVAQLTSGNYLKSIPGNPVAGAGTTTDQVAATMRDPRFATVGTAPNDVTYIYMNLGTDAGAICDAIARQSGQVTGQASAPTAVDGRPSGCFKASATAQAIAFARI